VNTTGVTQSSMTVTNIIPDSATINYNISNAANAGTATVYLYYYLNATSNVPILDTTTGVEFTNMTPLIPITLSANSNVNESVTVPISLNNYSFQFYNGKTNSESPILTDADNVPKFVTFEGIVSVTVSSMTPSNIVNTSAKITYAINNISSSNKFAYLYRFSTLPPNTLPISGATSISINSNTITANSTLSGSVDNTGITASTIYYYAFYDGNTLGSSAILAITGQANSYITVNTTGVTQSSLSISTLNSSLSGVSISYNILNAAISGTANVFLYYYEGIRTAVPILNKSTGLQATNTTATPSGPPLTIPANTTSVASGRLMSANFRANGIYSLQFYNGDDDLSSPILTNSSGEPMFVTFKKGSSVTEFTSTNILNTSVGLNYKFSNTNTRWNMNLYRFIGTSAPAILSSDGVYVTMSISMTGGTIDEPRVNPYSYTSTGLAPNTQYTYAFYGIIGTIPSVGIDTISSNVEGTPMTVTLTTTNVYNTIINASNISTTSAQINYTITNNPFVSGITVYLYRFTASSSPVVLDNTATNITSVAIEDSTTLTNSYTDNTLNFNNIYTYAFYNGAVLGLSQNLQYDSTVNNFASVTLNTFYGIVNGLSTSNTNNTSTNINYSITNGLSSQTTAYLYRFDGSITPPSTLNTSLPGQVYLTSVTINANATVTSTYLDSTLSINFSYTYAFYNGQTSAVSIILTDISLVSQYVSVTTSNVLPPTSNDVAVNTNSNTSIAVTLSASDPQSLALTYSLGELSSGTLTGTSPNLTYTPAVNFIGTVDFTYYATNTSLLQSNASTVTVNVAPVAPTAANVSTNTNINTSKAIILLGTDPQGQTLSYTVSQPSNGIVSATGSGSNVTYNPTTEFSGSDSFTYYVTNTSSLSSTNASVTIQINDTIPSTTDINTNTYSNTAKSITLIASDIQSFTLTYTVGVASHGIITSDGISPIITYTPILNFVGTDTFTYSVSNGTAESNTSTVTVIVAAQVPYTLQLNEATDINSPLTITLLGSDPQESQLEYFISSPTSGTNSGTGPNVVFTPATNYIGPTRFAYYVKNTFNLQSNESITNINVMPKITPINFNEDTSMQSFVYNNETYVKIEDLTLDTLVESMYNEYMPISRVGFQNSRFLLFYCFSYYS